MKSSKWLTRISKAWQRIQSAGSNLFNQKSMKSTSVKLEDDLNNEVLRLAKLNGKTKDVYMAWAVEMTVRRVKAIEKEIASRTPEEISDIIKERNTVILRPKSNMVLPAESLEVVTPVDENGMQTLPTYVFSMKDGSQIKQQATDIQDAHDILGIGPNDYLDVNKKDNE
jgi:hypothetical protein